MTDMTVRGFISKWRGVEQRERQVAQEHFIDICRLVGHPTPVEYDPTGETFCFEADVQKTGGGQGWADVWMKDHFAWEYKGPHKDLTAAYQQLLRYHENLGQPPLLVVSDMQRFEIHTKWPNTMPRVYSFTIEDLTGQTPFHYLRSLFYDPNALHPREFADKATEKAAARFAELADDLRKYHPARLVAHFLTQVVFCLFAEDIELLPRGPKGEAGIFTEIVRECQGDRYVRFPQYAQDLFQSMAKGGSVLFKDIAYFDGGLFTANGNTFIPPLDSEQLARLAFATEMDWSAVEPSIFGTLFERGLDPGKRSQIGAHYTSKADIVAIVEPVLMAPLRREWLQIQETVGAGNCEPQALRDAFLDKLAAICVLDPACGSGNFLYVSLNLLKDLEKEIILYFEELGRMPPAQPLVSPAQLYGIELNDYAHELANVVVWIGYIQWHRNNGYTYTQKPILQKLDNIRCMDAILGIGEDGALFKPEWTKVNVIVGNPPFLGGKKLRSELGNEYVDLLYAFYGNLIHGEADLVTYWFQRAYEQLEAEQADRVGLLATQGIRGQHNRRVLERIGSTGGIFFAESDRPWVQEGVAVRVSMVGFDRGNEPTHILDGQVVAAINSDLTADIDLPSAQLLHENARLSFMGTTKGGAFDLPPKVAIQMLEAPLNPNGKPNSDIVRPWLNGKDVTARPRGYYIIDFGVDMPKEKAAQYELPFEWVKKHVYPERQKNRQKAYRDNWWLFAATRSGMRRAFTKLGRYIATPRVAKYRLFVWLDTEIVPDSQLIVFARDDDYFFGVLHSQVHEIWALRQGTQLENRPRYTPTTTFETFPLPWTPGQEPTDDPLYSDIAEAARELNEKREAWLNPPGAEVLTLKRRTLTNLYNQKPEWLLLDHEKLDRAVFAAYGWEYPLSGEEILRRLLVLNLERAD